MFILLQILVKLEYESEMLAISKEFLPYFLCFKLFQIAFYNHKSLLMSFKIFYLFKYI